MNIRVMTIVSIILGVLLFGQSFQVAAIIKCQDAEGNWHMGDTVPPECVKTGYEEVSKQGMVKNVQEREKTNAELQEEARLAIIEKENQLKADERARKDRILLDTYTKVSGIEKSRDDNIFAIETRITLTKKRIEKIQLDLDKRIKSAAAAERSGKTANEELKKDIESLRRQIKNNEQFIADRRKEQESVKLAYQADIERFKQLKGLNN